MNTSEAQKQTVAGQLEDLASGTSERAAKVAGLVHERLESISRVETERDSPGAPQEAWPPLFESLRSHLMRIDSRLMEIEMSISRVEV